MRNAQCKNYNLVRKLKNVENEKHTIYELDYEEKTQKREK